ncbi:MAG: enoyl-CoA hydratase/isomerase family protein, partial [Oceanospirillum sp.]|nr:enoyl-CoA hydratase/isomerase family protein [Oceanospirillum sp.]
LLDELETALDCAVRDNKALLIASSGAVFAAGADLKEFMQLREAGGLERYIRRGQQLFQRIEASPVPVVAAVAGKALGGGVELLMHCHHVQLAAEAQLGLVEAQVGIVPGWGGCKKLLANSAQLLGADQAVEHCFNTLKSARVSHSALEAKALGFVSEHSAISMNPDRLLGDAIAVARSLKAKGEAATVDYELPALTAYQPDSASSPEAPFQMRLEQELLTLLNQASREGWYQAFDELELATDLSLAQNPGCLARMQHLLETGKPLQN